MQGKRVLVVVPKLEAIMKLVDKMVQGFGEEVWEYRHQHRTLLVGEDAYLFLPYNKNTAKHFVDHLKAWVFTDLILEVELSEEVERKIRIHVR